MNIAATHPEYADAFVLVANGGKRQEVGQVHFHMFTNHEVVNSNWEIRTVIPPASSSQMSDTYLRNILQSVDMLDEEFHIVQRGYSLVYQYNKQNCDKECPVFHIVSGKKQGGLS